MDKFKSFVIKYQLWFKVIIIVLLLCVIFTPLVHIHAEDLDTANYSVFDFVIRPSRLVVYNDPSILLFICAWLAFIGTIIIICLLLCSFHFRNNRQLLRLSSILYLVVFAFILFVTIYSLAFYIPLFRNMTNAAKTWGIPHIAFYLALLLLVADIICTVFWIKSHKPSPSKDERIAELEKRIEELESQTADKNKSTNIEKSNEKDGE